MPRIATNGVELEYEAFGVARAPAILLIMGLGAQMILWDEEFCEALAGRGYRVIRFDNRDVGLSTKLEHAGVPNMATALGAVAQGRLPSAPYTLHDMADDTEGLLGALGIDAAHVVGASMGGMIAQTLAIRHPQRIRTLTSIMSTTGNPELPRATPAAMQVLMTPAPTHREGFIEHHVEVSKVIGSPGFPFNAERVRARGARVFDRGGSPAGIARQMVAILASGNRKPALASVRAPTLVIHGDADPLVPIAAGHDTAEAVPGAELLVIEGMGHDLPREAWPRLVDAIAKHAGRATP
jgi:pimeloyl-ACP methyl ester carboxylesterase